ncbi:MAG TPA: hypothetical protein VKS79_13000, partial [Gemmataceae bacterium]|nr:hypothetical protein [Gemmataceae bacterium]
MKVIVIQVDGLQLAALGAYGNVWVDTPHLDMLAASSVVFDQHFVGVPSAEGIARALYGGKTCFPLIEGKHDVKAGQTILELLSSRNVICHVVHQGRQNSSSPEVEPISTPCSVLGADDLQGHLRPLDEFENALVWLQTDIFPPWEVSPDRFAKQCEDWEFEEEPPPWPDPEPGWLNPADDISFARLQRTYAAVVEDLDEKLGEWFDLLAQQAWWREAVFIFTAARGQNL